MSYKESLRDPRWQKMRLKMLEYRKWTCEACGATDKELQIHHRAYVPGKQPWEYHPNDLYCLCKDCHLRVTEMKSRIEDLIWRGSMEMQFNTAEFILDVLLGRNTEKVMSQIGGYEEDDIG